MEKRHTNECGLGVHENGDATGTQQIFVLQVGARRSVLSLLNTFPNSIDF